MSTSLGYLSERISDSGNVIRFYGKAAAVGEVMQDRPLIGIGMGGENQDTFLDDQVLYEGINVSVFFKDDDQFSSYSGSYFFGLVAAGGIIALVIFYLMILGMIYKPETRFLGILIFALGITKGGVFDLYFWLIITISFVIGDICKKEEEIILR